jgi:hypothetical protein
MAKQRRQPETFDVSEFLRPTDQDMKSALISILGPGNVPDSQPDVSPADSSMASPSEAPDVGHPAPISLTKEGDLTSKSSPTPDLNTEIIGNPDFTPPSRLKTNSPNRLIRRGILPLASSFDLRYFLKIARSTYRLNRSELSLYEMFLNLTHAVGKTQCEATNRKISEVSGLIEKNVRRNLKSLRARGLITQLRAYDPYTHEPALFDVHLPSLATKDRS